MPHEIGAAMDDARGFSPSTETTARSSSVAIVVPQQTTKSLTALDLTVLPPNFVTRFDDLATDPLVISFSMIMVHELPNSRTKHLLAEKDHS